MWRVPCRPEDVLVGVAHVLHGGVAGFGIFGAFLAVLIVLDLLDDLFVLVFDLLDLLLELLEFLLEAGNLMRSLVGVRAALLAHLLRGEYALFHSLLTP